MDEKALENDHDQADGVDESNLSEVGVIGSTVWAESEISRGNDTYLFFLCLLYTNDIIFILSLCLFWYCIFCHSEQSQEVDQNEQEHTAEVVWLTLIC